MEITLWILGGWLTLGVAVGLWIAAFIRSGDDKTVVPAHPSFSRPTAAASHR